MRMMKAENASRREPRILVLFGSAVVFGAERGNVEALRALKDQGAEILCLVRDESWSAVTPVFLDASGLRWQKAPYVLFGRGIPLWSLLVEQPVRFIRANIAFLRVIRAFRPTHIHAYGQPFVANFALGLACVRVPLIYRAGDAPVLHNWIWRLTWGIVRKRATRIVANSLFVARSLAAAGINPKIIKLIYNAPPTRTPDFDHRAEPPLPTGARIVAYVGQIAEHKGPHVLIEAFERIADRYPNVFLALAGRISDWSGDAWGRALREKAQNSKFFDRISFLGQIESVPLLLAQSEFLVVPSLFDDPAPNVVMEAKEASRPVIGFARGGIPELIQHGVDGLLCDETTAAALEKALDVYLSDRELVTSHGAASRRSLERLEVSQFKMKWSEAYGILSCETQGNGQLTQARSQ